MSFWFFLVIAAYVFMWLITDELDTITESVLALIGIGAATALASTLIDQKKEIPQPDEPGGKSRGFLNDVMSDPTGVSLHRFQMFVWTLVLGVIFCGNVFKDLEMPQFSATLLGLMGISSGTYLGFKVPEKKGSDTPPGATPSPEPETPPA
jgi:ribose/xylose/arabinose/galactoside ABC-type transport system permease subunit